MRLILVRHGQTSCNIDEIWHGWDDCALTAEGQRQAEAVAERLAGEPIAAVYSSDIRRALQTARAVSARHGLEPVIDAGLRERLAGEFEGIRVADVLAAHPTVWEERNADYWGWRPPGGETFTEVWQRVSAVLDRLKAQHDGQTVVMVTHMCPVRLLMCQLIGMPIGDTYQHVLPSTGVSIFALEGDQVVVEALNDASHVTSSQLWTGVLF
jgi:probable phosphoglycerate mutase